MNKFRKYRKPTAELLLSLLDSAYKDEIKIDQMIEEISDEVVEEYIKLIKKYANEGKIDLEHKFRLRDYPQIYREVKDLERQAWDNRMDKLWSWLNVVYTDSLARTYKDTVNETLFLFSKEFNLPIGSDGKVELVMPMVQITDTYITSNVLPIPWCQDGKTYSQRLYGHVANFQSKLDYVLEQGITNGKGMDWMMQAWRKLTGSTAYDAARLLKTETVAMWSRATKETYLTIGIEYVEIVGDAECGGICLDYVGEAIPLREAELGDELPPYHPNCACSYVAYEEEKEIESFDEEFEEE